MAVTVAEDARDSLKAARAKLERDLPAWEGEAAQAAAGVEAVISVILSNHARAVPQEARKAVAVLAPLKSALVALWAEQRQVATQEYFSYEDGRRPLNETKNAIKDFLESLNRIERADLDPWREARARLRRDPAAAIPPELDALLDG